MIIRIIFWIVIILVIAFFVIFNIEPRVEIHILPGKTIENIPLALVIIISFVIGLLSGVVFSFSQIIKYKLENRKIRKEKEKLEKELLSTYRKEKTEEEKKEKETNGQVH